MRPPATTYFGVEGRRPYLIETFKQGLQVAMLAVASEAIAVIELEPRNSSIRERDYMSALRSQSLSEARSQTEIKGDTGHARCCRHNGRNSDRRH